MTIKRKQKGLTLFETLLSLTIVMALVVSFLYWYMEQQREQQATIFGKDIVSIITAFDKRIHLDGWDIDNFKNGTEWSGSPEILEMLNNEFVAKESTCGNEKAGCLFYQKRNQLSYFRVNSGQESHMTSLRKQK